MAGTRDELKRLAKERNISMGAMVERLIRAWDWKWPAGNGDCDGIVVDG
jgi:hypothetical protein